MTQAFNLAQLANNLNTSGQLDATDGLTGLVAGSNLASSGTADSSTFLRGDRTWSSIGSLGKILQVVQTYSSSQISFNNTAAWADSGISAAITPSSSSSRILIMTSFGNGQANGYNNIFGFTRNGTTIGGNTGQFNAWIGEDVYMSAGLTTSSAMYIDSPATTSALTYRLQVRCDGGTGYLNRAYDGGGASLGQTTGSTQIILMEIGA